MFVRWLKTVAVPFVLCEVCEIDHSKSLTSAVLSDEQIFMKSFYLEQIWSDNYAPSIHNTKWGYYPTCPFWPLTGGLKSVNGAHFNTETENMAVCHARCADVTIWPIKVPDTHAAAPRGHLSGVNEYNSPPATQFDWMQWLMHKKPCEHSNYSLQMTPAHSYIFHLKWKLERG